MNTNNIKHGIIGGLSGGLIFGMMMWMMGMLPMIGKMVGLPNVFGGWIVHLAISATIGASFAVLLDRFVKSYPSGAVTGLIYGAAWWFLGPLTLMPLMMGMGFGVNWNATAAVDMAPSLMGHAIFGVALGLVYARTSLSRRVTRPVVDINVLRTEA
jgi:hypothetical protein